MLCALQGGFISLCSDDTVYHWSFAGKRPELVNSIQFSRERCAAFSPPPPPHHQPESHVPSSPLPLPLPLPGVSPRAAPRCATYSSRSASSNSEWSFSFSFGWRGAARSSFGSRVFAEPAASSSGP